MRRYRGVILLAVLVVIAAGCSNNDDNAGSSGATGGGASGQSENIGSVNVLSALDPSEATPMQAVFDDKINSQTDYKAEIEADGNFEQDVQIRAQAGTLDVILLPQPGAVVEQAKSGNAVSLEDMGFNIDDLNATFGEYFMSLGEYNGEHYGIPTNINLKSMVWYPKAEFDTAGYTVPKTWDEMLALSDQIVADGGTPWCVGFGSEGATGWPATDWIEDIMLRTAGLDTYAKWATHQIPFNDPSVLNAAKIFGNIMFHRDTCWAEPTRPRRSPSATRRCRCSTSRLVAGCTVRRASSTRSSPRRRSRGRLRLVPSPSDRSGRNAVRRRTRRWAGNSENAPEVKDFLTRFMSTDVQCAMGADVGTSRSRRTSTWGARLREPDPRRRVGDPDERIEERDGGVRRLGHDAPGRWLGELLDGNGEVHEGRA